MPELYNVFKDLVAGTVGGCSGIIVGHPLDTVKVRVQASSVNITPLSCLQKILREEGARALWKGILSPLIGNGPLNAVAFASNAHANRFLDRYFPRQVHADNNGILTPDWGRLTLAGLWSGFCQSFVATPVELIKCQMQSPHLIGKFSSSIDCVKARVAEMGFQKGLYRGFWVTVLRDSPSFAAYFVAYEWTKFKLHPPRINEPGAGHPAWVLLTAGGVAGAATWLSTYPVDVVKSAIQCLPSTTADYEYKLLHVTRNMYRQFGLRYFFRGMAVTVVRAIPVNAVTFLIYESCLGGFQMVESNLESPVERNKKT